MGACCSPLRANTKHCIHQWAKRNQPRISPILSTFTLELVSTNPQSHIYRVTRSLRLRSVAHQFTTPYARLPHPLDKSPSTLRTWMMKYRLCQSLSYLRSRPHRIHPWTRRPSRVHHLLRQAYQHHHPNPPTATPAPQPPHLLGRRLPLPCLTA